MIRALYTAFTLSLFFGSLLAQSPQNPTTGAAPPDHPTPAAGQPTDPSSPTQANPPGSMSAPTATNAATNSAPRVAPGSVIPVQLTKTVDAKKAKKGDEVVAKVTQDLQNNAGAVIVPKDTRVVGHVVDAQARNKEQKESQLAIAFDKAELKDGEQLQLPMSIQAIVAPRNPANNNTTSQTEPPSNYPGPGTGASPAASGAGRAGSMGGNPVPTPTPSSGNSGTAADASSSAASQLQITGATQGVIGIPNLTLSTANSGTQGSLLTSEKNNVKLDDGTLLLLRVNQ